MSRKARLTSGALALAICATPVMLAAPALAAVDAPGWIAQAGDTKGGSAPILKDFDVRTVLFDANRFGRGLAKYLAWGTVATSTGRQLALRRSDDGVNYGPAEVVRIHDATGIGTPLLLTGRLADVVYTGASERPFAIYWLAHTERAGIADAFYGESLLSIHRAFSADGVNFGGETPLVEACSLLPPLTSDPTASRCTSSITVLDGASADGAGDDWKVQTYGPSDVIFQPGMSTSTCTAANPWGCSYVMLYDAVGKGANNYVGLAYSTDGLVWTGRQNPILCPGSPQQASMPARCPSAAGTAWDSYSAFNGRIHRIGSSYTLYYAGATSNMVECGSYGPCFEVGVATSTNGLTFTKRNVNEPAVGRSLIDLFAPGRPVGFTPGASRSTLNFPQAITDQGPNARVYYSRRTFPGPCTTSDCPASTSTDTYLAYTTLEPSDGPSVRISSPKPGATNIALTTIEIMLSDSKGSTVAKTGLDLATLSVTIDGAPAGFGMQETLATAIRTPAVKLTGSTNLADGAHTLAVSVKDRDGNLGSATVDFFIDASTPTTIITACATEPQVVAPGDSIGTFKGTSTDATSPLQRVRAIVTNPLGQTKTYDSLGQGLGWSIVKSTPSSWSWTWVAPSSDPHFLAPGSYTLRFSAVDAAGNAEPATSRNVATVIII